MDANRSGMDSVLDFYTDTQDSRQSTPEIDFHSTSDMMRLDDRHHCNSHGERGSRSNFDRAKSWKDSLESLDRRDRQLEGAPRTFYRYSQPGPDLVQRHHSLSRIPQPRHKIVRSMVPGEATRFSFYDDDGQDNDLSEQEKFQGSTRRFDKAASRVTTSKSQLPRSLSMPAKSRSQHDQARYARSMNFDSLPARKTRHNATEQLRRSTSVSASSTHHYTKDAKLAREEQARRVHAVNNAPKGLPPWLDSYQPDPRVPVDQQLLPTIARKLAQQQSEVATGTKDDSVQRDSRSKERSPFVMSPAPLPLTKAGESCLHIATIVPENTSPSQEVAIERLGQDPDGRTHTERGSATVTPNFSRKSTQALKHIASLDAIESRLFNDPISSRTAQVGNQQAQGDTNEVQRAQQHEEKHTRECVELEHIKLQKKAVCCTIM